jgi:SAM-dependent methyltransferase
MMDEEEIRTYNRGAWNLEVKKGNQWTIPVSTDTIAAARKGDWQIVLTPTIPVPRNWFPVKIANCDILCLASGGGQQGPVLAATGANVTVFDNSPRQLERDRLVAERDSLHLTTIEGDMCDLYMFSQDSFDLIIHPVSNCFIPDVLPVWQEAFRVLRHGGALLAGIVNPILYMFDDDLMQKGIFDLKYSIPYSDLTSLPDGGKRYLENGEPLAFGHTLQDQIGGQIDAGFVLAGFYEDVSPNEPISMYTPTFIATRAIKI